MLSERVQELHHSVEESLKELEQHATRIDALMISLNRSHRCWPSRVGFLGLIGCLVYVIFLHSFHQGDSLREAKLVETFITITNDRLTRLEAPPLVKKRWWQR